jgi:hypothetical protein
MQSSGTTDDLEPGDPRVASEEATIPLAVPMADTEKTLPLPVSSGRDRCGACGAPLAPDQRYCVECGQRRGQSRVEFMEQLAPPPAPASERTRRRFPRVSANAALIAGVGTLMLAMGVGVLIGRSAVSEKSGGTPIKVVTVGGGSTTSGATTEATTGTPETSSGTASEGTKASTTTGGSSAGGSATKGKSESKASTSKAAAKSTQPRAKVVKLGSHGKGKGYNEKEEFTGEFFGKGE